MSQDSTAKLMLKMGIYAIYPKPNHCPSAISRSLLCLICCAIIPCLFPNQVWSIDITYIPMP